MLDQVVWIDMDIHCALQPLAMLSYLVLWSGHLVIFAQRCLAPGTPKVHCLAEGKIINIFCYGCFTYLSFIL